MTRKLSGTSKQSGLTLIELLISVALTLSLSIALIQLHTQSKLIADRQQSVSRQLENAATLSHIVGHSLRDALETVSFSAGSVEGSDEVVLSAFNQRCVGISSGGQCLAPVLSWNMDDVGAPDISGVSSGSSVLQVKQNCCPDVIADQFYLARRGNNQSNPLSLYRRRMKTDGSYTAAAEMVESIAEIEYLFIVKSNLTGDLALLDYSRIENWWSVLAVRVHAQLSGIVDAGSPGELSFTISSRQRQHLN